MTGEFKHWHKPLRLYEEIARDLADEIVREKSTPGEFLPTEQKLASKYGASRNIIREAVKLLSARGLVDTIHGRGSRVLPYERWQASDQLVRIVRENPEVPQNLLELRRIIETEVAGLAASRAYQSQIQAMEKTIQQMQAGAGEPEVSIEQDMKFHELLAEASGNDLLLLVLEPIQPLLRANREAAIRNVGVVERSLEAHAAILARVKEGDEVGARMAMQEHLEQAEYEVLRMQTEPPDAASQKLWTQR